MRAAVAAIALAGCVSVPKLGQPKCSSDSDCATDGEVCQDGLCWGDPPAGTFAAALAPPVDRTDLVTTELPMLALPAGGWLGNLVLDASVTISGRVEAYCAAPAQCDSNSLGAAIIVTRAPMFAGGPGFRATVQSQSGVPRGAASFSITVPRTHDGDPPYIVSILPDGRSQPPTSGGVADAELAPPAQISMLATDNVNTTFTLGSASSPLITGAVTDSSGHLLKAYRIVAVGRFDAGAGPTEVSTVAFTNDGNYSITLSDGIVGPIELVASPTDPMAVAPTLHQGGLPAVSAYRALGQPANLGNPTTVSFRVQGLSGSGDVAPVSGARVTVTGTYSAGLMSSSHTDYEYDITTGDDGMANLMVLDGGALAPSYVVQVAPPAGSNLGIVYNTPLAQVSDTLRLPPRTALSGIVVDSHGDPLGKVSVTAQPSLRFQWSLDVASQAFLSTVPAATTASTDDGHFAVYVDPLIADTWGHYDLTFEPPAASGEPHWTMADVEIPRIANQTTLGLGTIPIPDAAWVHGQIADAGGVGVASGTLTIYQLVTDLSLCNEVAHAPATCTIPAVLVGHGISDESGTVKLTLARSP